MDSTGELEAALARAQRLRFLCSGNVVRSAFAELLARHLGCPLPVDSAATRYRNAAIFPETRRALLDRGLSPAAIRSFRPRHLASLEGSGEEPLVLAMTPEHLRELAELRPAARGFLLGRLDPEGGDPTLADPVLEGAGFEETWVRIERAVQRLLAQLAR